MSTNANKESNVENDVMDLRNATIALAWDVVVNAYANATDPTTKAKLAAAMLALEGNLLPEEE